VGITDIANVLWQFVASPERIIEVSRAELLDRLGWTDLFRFRHHHDFPVDRRVYRPPPSARLALDRLLGEATGGYIAVVGPPGSGKSSLLTESLRLRRERVVRYYAFVPGDSAAAVRGEALTFLHDTVLRLRRLGFSSRELLRDDPHWLQRELGIQLQLLGRSFEEKGEQTILLVDGLDHATRDPQPERAFLAVLPEPDAVPPGVLIVLGTQTTELQSLSASIRTQVSMPDRRLEVAPLDGATVDAVIDSWGITPSISADDRRSVHRVANGHPLTLTYVLRQVADAPPDERARRLLSAPTYGGDLRAYYESHWTTLQTDEQVAAALLHAARLRGPIDIPWLVNHLDSPGVGTRLVDRAGHYFRRPAPDRWTFFHDSFRQFLVERTATDDLAIHRRIAQWLESKHGSPELLYHRLKAGDDEGALALATFGYFRGQLGGARPQEAIERDARLLAGVAAARRDVDLLVRLMFIAAEMANRAYFVDRPHLVRVLAGLGDIAAVIAFAEQPAQLGERDRIGLDASLALARAGALEPAMRLLDEENSDLLRDPGSFAREWIEDVRTWGRASARLLQDAAIAEVMDALRTADAGSGNSRVGFFATAAVEELVATGELERASAVASSLDLDAEGESDACARAHVSLLEGYRLSGGNEAQASLAHHAIDLLRGRPLSHEALYRLMFELAAARLPDVPDIVTRLEGPGTLDLTGLEGFRRYRPAMWWTAVRTATGGSVDANALEQQLGEHADAGVVRVVHTLGQLLGSAVAKPIDVWSFRERALEITRSFVLGRGKRPLDDYPLEQARFGAHDALIKSAMYLGGSHLDTLFSLYEEEWARPHVGWPDELKRRILRTYLPLGGYEARVRPLLSALNSPPPRGDVSSRFVTLLEYAESWLALGDRERARDAVVQALESGFGVGYRKDYQLDFWLPWLEKMRQVDPAGMPARLAAMAGPLKELDDLTEGRATELAASSLVEIAAGWQPAAGSALLRWLLDAGAVTFHGGVLALLTKGIEVGADPAAVASLAGAWTIPLEREAQTSFATALCRRLAAAASSRGVEYLRLALQNYSRPSIRPAWAQVMRDELAPAGLVTTADVDQLITSGFVPWSSSPTSGYPSPPDGDPDSRSIDDLIGWLESDGHISRERLQRVVPPVVAAANSPDISRLADVPAPAVALCVAAEELARRGQIAEAQRLAEAALARRNPNGWDRWYDGGTVLDTLALLRSLAPMRGRELAFEALRQDLMSGEGNPMWVLRSLAELLPHLTDDDMVREVWASVEEYLYALLHVESATQRPDLSNVPNWSFDAALVDLAGSLLAHPVTLIAQLTREAEATLAGNGWQPVLDGLSRQLVTDQPEAIVSALSVIEAAAQQSKDVVDVLKPSVERHLNSPMLDVRLAACRLLGQPATSVAAMPRPGPPPPIYRISLPPTMGRLTRRRLVPDMGELVRDTQDVFEIVGAFEDEVRALAHSAGIDAATLAHRVIQVTGELGLQEQLGEAGERATQARLRSMYLEYPYVRPRSGAVRLALAHVAAELLDLGLIDTAAVARLKTSFQWTDGAFDALQPERAPAWLPRPIRGRDDHGPIHEWARQVRSDPQGLPATSFGLVVAESSTVRSLDWPRPTERRRRTLVPEADAGAIAASEDELFGSITVPLVDYPMVFDPEGPLVFRSFTMRFQSTKPSWLTINSAAAKSLGWRPDATNLCGWAASDGEPRVRSTVWMDGVIDAPSPELDDQPACGAYLAATPEALDELEAAFGRLLVVESVQRDAREGGMEARGATRGFWDWRGLM
jgi:tetratricopeptide (TPR) repeat protein